MIFFEISITFANFNRWRRKWWIRWWWWWWWRWWWRCWYCE